MASSNSVLEAGNFSKFVFNARANEGPWQDYNLSPANRNVFPRAVHVTEGTIHDANAIVDSTSVHGGVLIGKGASVTLDFGVNTCGIVSLKFGSRAKTSTKVALAFTESKQFISKHSDQSMDFLIEDGELVVDVEANGIWTMPKAKVRGAFRYITIYLITDGPAEVTSVWTYNNSMPSLNNLREYAGYWYSSDDFLNKIWYAGAYTIQLSTIPTDTGRRHDYIMKNTGWDNDVQCGKGLEVLSDGAKRDRSVWSGDRSISVLSDAVTFRGSGSINGTEWLMDHQLPTGEFPYAARPIDMYGSDTYHLWTLANMYNCYYLGGDKLKWIEGHWPKYKLGIDYAKSNIDENGLFLVTKPLDWGRNVLQGHNMEANCILYYDLINGAKLARKFGEQMLASEWLKLADKVKDAVNTYLWNDSVGMYTDFIGSNILCQDGNSLSIWFGIAPTERAKSVSKGLTQFWNEYGAVAQESPGMISPFASGMELIAHFEAVEPQRAIDLIRLMWGYIWNSPYSVQSSLIEGYYNDGTCYYPFTLYDASYISHAHPWSTGPTAVLSLYVAGLQLMTEDHTEWRFKPQADIDLEFAMAGFESAVGFFSIGWQKVADNIFQMAIKAPKSTRGQILLPTFGKSVSLVLLDGKVLDLSKVEKDGMTHVKLPTVEGCNHHVFALYQVGRLKESEVFSV
ncbi:hypothetical protein LIPSTDRAFT_783 [Lipomyces starkeyi NRRL Y-11557]|uniref:Alpha-L-rhamnosidase six-hairpin glycosidase domain-containing protein n=1 Tax=Lipomyces starkeyi NRRL Y-11557 TaxID=675824 RepID=A0A1E3QCZ4_LIPST|nr:hypothetical protein LIPSTDRAFT_783 [Lipomyces starkeyi NRRL Y-11557]